MALVDENENVARLAARPLLLRGGKFIDEARYDVIFRVVYQLFEVGAARRSSRSQARFGKRFRNLRVEFLAVGNDDDARSAFRQLRLESPRQHNHRETFPAPLRVPHDAALAPFFFVASFDSF